MAHLTSFRTIEKLAAYNAEIRKLTTFAKDRRSVASAKYFAVTHNDEGKEVITKHDRLIDARLAVIPVIQLEKASA